MPMMPPQQTDMPACLHGADRVEPVLEGVGGDDLRVKLRAGVEIVIVGGDARLAELPRRLGRELPERDADLHAELGSPRGPSRAPSANFASCSVTPRQAAPMQKRVLPLARARSAVSRMRASGSERLALQAGVVVGALGAVGAILAAAAGLDAQQRAELHLVLRPVGAIDLARLRDQVEERQLVKRAEGSQVVAGHETPTLARMGSLPQVRMVP